MLVTPIRALAIKPTGGALRMPAKVDRSALIGKRFGRWTVLGEIKARKWKAYRQAWTPQWRLACRCECGTLGSVPADELATGHSTSCGCYSAEATGKRRTKHGHTKGRKWTAEFSAWQHAKQRCFDKNCADYADYGGRGITMHPDWISDFPSFLAHVGEKPSRRMSINRIDNERGYEPGNVKWSTAKEQANNRRSPRRRQTSA